MTTTRAPRSPTTHAQPWWFADRIERLLADLIRAEWRRMRPGQDACTPSLDPGELGLDSIEFLDLATLVSACFHLHRTERDDDLLRVRRFADWVDSIRRSRATWDDLLSFQTSGSTGRPKLCAHPVALLEQEIDWFARRFADRRRILTSVPAHHIYGFLFTILLPARLGIPVHDCRSQLPATALRQARPGDLFVSYPTYIELTVREQPLLAADITLLSSTGRLEAELWRQLKQAGCAQIIEIYGSSETAGVGVRDAAAAPFELLPHWLRVPDDDCLGADGELQRLDNSSHPVRFTLPDQLDWLDPRHFVVRGRRDGAVQIAGVNIFPRRVSEVLSQHPDVAQAEVRLAGRGQSARLKAFVVPTAECRETGILTERLRTWLASRLTPLECPRSIQIGAQLPRTALGKLADWDEPRAEHEYRA